MQLRLRLLTDSDQDDHAVLQIGCTRRQVVSDAAGGTVM